MSCELVWYAAFKPPEVHTKVILIWSLIKSLIDLFIFNIITNMHKKDKIENDVINRVSITIQIAQIEITN